MNTTKLSAEKMKIRVEKQLSDMGYANDAKYLIEKYWGKVEYLSSSRSKALYMIA